MKKYIILPFLILLFIISAFYMATTTVENTKQTLDLIINVILPTLLPFLLLTLLFVEFGGVEIIAYLLQYITLPFLKVSGEGFCAFISGILGGSPVGAIITSKLVDENTISISEGQKIFNISSFISPSFIFVTLLGVAVEKNITLNLIIAYYLGSIIILILSNYFYPCKTNYLKYHELKEKLNKRYTNFNLAKIIKATIKSAANSLLIISGTMVLFNLPYNIINLFLDSKSSYLFSGFFEFSKSSIALLSSFSDKVTLLVVVMILASGGLSILIQNLGVATPKLKISSYLATRVVHILLSACLFLLFYPS